MGASKDIMHTYISREIAGVYAESAGWTIAQSNILSGYNQVDVLERIVNGRREAVLLGVTFDRVVPENFIAALDKATVGKSVYSTAQSRREILVPRNADVSSVPKEYAIRYMNSFGYEGEALIWYKKPVQVEKPVNA